MITTCPDLPCPPTGTINCYLILDQVIISFQLYLHIFRGDSLYSNHFSNNSVALCSHIFNHIVLIQSSPCNPVYIIQYIYSFQMIQSISSNHSNPIHIIQLICCLPSNVIQAVLILCIHQSLVSFRAKIFPRF